MAAKFFCLGCEEHVKSREVSVNFVRFRHPSDSLRFHASGEGFARTCGPLVWLTPDLETAPSRDQVLGSLRRAAYEAYGMERAEILLRAVEKGWKT